ncbi:DUF2927 domain-containing protein [Leisingera aquaemixtae]|uniref:DUF2927 domain-containing protein n=1 Tax=Leisingera aquaemixtae TaxID=1396826 RepID=UPI001C969D4C|nr:DUF2927 domain-containing protein [Leisingera aquaemixtae]MBY6065779.1 DUF2927 domain-containing protein [Leisingera aquaemixtae]
MNSKFLTSLFFATFLPAATGAGGLLERQDCESISAYDRENSLSFPERFAKMAHQREYCFDDGAACQVPLMKRVEDFYVVVRGERHFASDQLSQVAGDALVNVAKQVLKTTGIRPLFTRPSGASNFAYLVFVDKEIANDRFDDYVTGWITPDSVAANADGKAELRRIFQNFLDVDQPCMVINHLTDHNRIERAQIWIRADLDEVQMRRCIAEEFYNSLGLSEGVEVGSIFDFRFSHGADDVELSSFDLLLLKILYWKEIPIGSTRGQSVKSVERLLATDCKIKQ